MAGPGGGPPRKSHTKSRNGCKTCKRRHIRCDETFPQCRNCTKHNCRCDYMDVAAAREESSKSPAAPNLMITAEIEQELESWRMSGVPPFLELSHFPQGYWHQTRKTDLRLIHHIVGLSNDFRQRGLSETTVWVPKMNSFLAIAQSSDFVMSSILAFAASHLEYNSGSHDTHGLAFHHRGVALKGLQKAISSWSKENSESILAASILLSWQATEWTSWASLQQGLSSVLDAMLPFWKEESELAQYLESRRAFHSNKSGMNSGYPGGVHLFQRSDLSQLDNTLAHLQIVQGRVQHNREFNLHVNDLRDFLQKVRNDSPIASPSKAFERLQPLRSWLFWLPTRMLRNDDYDLGALAVLAQFFSAALVLEPLYPEIEGAYFGDMAVAPLEAIDRIFQSQKAARFSAPEFDLAHSLIEYPHHVLTTYKSSHAISYRLMPLTGTSQNHFPNAFTDVSVNTSSPVSTSATYATYTSSVRSPSVVTSSNSPYHTPGQYASSFGHHQFYPESPLHSDAGEERARMPDYNRGGGLGHTPEYTVPYTDHLHDGGLPAVDNTSGVNMGFIQETPLMHIGSVVPALWT